MTTTLGAALTDPDRKGPGRPRSARVDEAIIDAVIELFSEGVTAEALSIEAVATRAGVGKATVYRRWPSKEDLAVAAMETLYSAEMPEPDTGDIRADLAASYRSVLAFVNTPEGEAFLRTSIAESVRDDRIAALHRESTERREAASRETFERAIARGQVRPDIDVDSAVQWLGGLLATRAITHRPMPRIEDADTLVEFTLRGVGA